MRVPDTTANYECVQLDHHNKIARVIEEHKKNGWHLLSYQVAPFSTSFGAVNHYLLFEKG